MFACFRLSVFRLSSEPAHKTQAWNCCYLLRHHIEWDRGTEGDRNLFRCCSCGCGRDQRVARRHLCPFCCTTKAEVSKVKHVIVHTDNAIPVRYHRLVHLFNVLEGTIAELQYVGMVEVCVGSKEHLTPVKIVVFCSHNVSIFLQAIYASIAFISPL